VQDAARRLLAVVLAAAATVTAATVIPAAAGARPTSTTELRQADAAVAAQERSVELELYAIEAQLASSRAEFAELRSRADRVAARHAVASRNASLARLQLQLADRLLAERVLALYQQGEIDPLAILFGADSLGEAIDGLEGLSTLAAQDSRLAAQARLWKQRARAEARKLAHEIAALRRAERAAQARAGELEDELAARTAFLAGLRARRQLTAAQIAEAEAGARAAQEKSQALSQPGTVFGTIGGTATPAAPSGSLPPSDAGTVSEPVPASPSPPFPARPRTLTVVASGYALPGRTATGIRVSWGVVAVDPSVIPLGTRMTIPGYGEGVAADVGSAIKGARIDLWFPTRAKALEWGLRTVTITVH
jgi:cystine transport system substrate-binding protein